MIVETLFLVLIGLIAGVIVNALADDLPMRESPQLPHYSDGTTRPPLAWSGIIAFLSGKRTAANGAKLSWRHPLAELLTIALMILTANRADTLSDFDTLQLVFWLIYVAIFVLITVIDIEHKLILFVVIIPSAVIALADTLVTSYEPNIVDALIGAGGGFVVFFLMYNGGFLFTYAMGKLRGKEIKEIAFGYGDVMMATLSGLILGWQFLIFALVITIILGAAGALLYIISRRLLGAKYSMFTALPYGPYIVAGTIITMLYPEQVANFLLPG